MAEINDTLLPLSLTQAEITAITTPNTGDIIFNSTTSLLQFWNGLVWINASEGSIDVLETATVQTIITPAILNVDQDNYNPTGFSSCNMIRQDVSGNRIITGFQAPAVGENKVFGINCISGSDNIKFKNNDAGSIASNRLLLRDNAGDKTIKENETAIFWYDHISQRYRPYNRIG